jgi:hypothetical protein
MIIQMIRSPIVGVLLALFLTGCANSPPPPQQPPPAPTTRPTTRLYSSLAAINRAMSPNTIHCPFGHARVVVIPSLGGCIFWSPDFNQTLICLQCGYGHDPAQETWQKGSTDPTSFQAALDPLILNFPILAGESKPQFYQSVLATRSVHEGILYRSVQAPAVLEPQVAAYLNNQKIPTTRTALTDVAGEIITLSGDAPQGSVRINLTKSSDQSKSQVTFELIQK